MMPMAKDIYVKSEKLAKELGVKLLPKGITEFEVRSQADLQSVKKLEEKGITEILVSCPNWKVIPLENLIALSRKMKIIAKAKDVDEAKMAFEILEKGVDGVLFENENEKDINALMAYLHSGETLEIVTAKIRCIKRVGLGARSCVDTSDIMNENESMLLGSTSNGFVLMQPEVSTNPHVAPRPFRVNAGAISLYILAEGSKTKYLSEISAGDKVMVVDRNGRVRTVSVVRNKIEYRPMLLIEAEAPNKQVVKSVVQEAETIRMLTPEGSKSVAELKEGDAILVNVQAGGRHFGMKVDETIIEQ